MLNSRISSESMYAYFKFILLKAIFMVNCCQLFLKMSHNI